MAKYYVNAACRKSRINKEIYGHFAEHLGRCIYEGLYVGENSDIPNVNGMRTDVVEALKEIRVPVLRWPGGCFACPGPPTRNSGTQELQPVSRHPPQGFPGHASLPRPTADL